MSRKRQPFYAMVTLIGMWVDNMSDEDVFMIHHVICLRLVRAEPAARMTFSATIPAANRLPADKVGQ